MEELTQLNTWSLFQEQLMWLQETVGSVAKGNVDGLNHCINKWADCIKADPILSKMKGNQKIENKIMLVAFLDLVFASTTAIKFDDVKAKANLTTDEQVERLAMRAMRLGIVKG